MESWDKVLAVQRMQNYIEEHVREPITLRMLAEAANYSPWHSARIFKEITGKAPFEYIRSLRLSLAASALQDHQKLKILDVAFDFVFDSHEGFTRAFSKEFGMTPRDFSKSPVPLKLFLPRSAYDYYSKLQKGENVMTQNVNTVFVQVVDRPARKVILKRGKKATHYFEYCDEVGCEIWDILSSIKEALYEPIGMWLPDTMRTPGTSVYAQGVEVPLDFAGDIPEGLEIMELPACKMMIFQGQPYDDEKFETAIGELWDVMKTYNPEVYGFQWADEEGPRFQLAPMGYRGYIEGRPVRPLSSRE